MGVDLRTYSEGKIGSVWCREDHDFLVAALSKIDRTCIEVWERMREELKGQPMRLDELLTMEPPPPRVDKYTLELPFDSESGLDQ
jgi:hypothetical protein